jgi:hypothetical protein
VEGQSRHPLLRTQRITGMNYYTPAAQDRARDAASDAIEKVLNGMSEPLSRHALNARWKRACEAMDRFLEAQDTGEE